MIPAHPPSLPLGSLHEIRFDEVGWIRLSVVDVASFEFMIKEVGCAFEGMGDVVRDGEGSDHCFHLSCLVERHPLGDDDFVFCKKDGERVQEIGQPEVLPLVHSDLPDLPGLHGFQLCQDDGRPPDVIGVGHQPGSVSEAVMPQYVGGLGEDDLAVDDHVQYEQFPEEYEWCHRNHPSKGEVPKAALPDKEDPNGWDEEGRECDHGFLC